MIIYQKAFPFCNSPVDSTNEPLNSFFPFLSPIANIFLMKDWKQRRKRKIFNDINFKKLQKLVPLFCKIKRWEQIQENKQPNNTLGFRKKKKMGRERKKEHWRFFYLLPWVLFSESHCWYCNFSSMPLTQIKDLQSKREKKNRSKYKWKWYYDKQFMSLSRMSRKSIHLPSKMNRTEQQWSNETKKTQKIQRNTNITTKRSKNPELRFVLRETDLIKFKKKRVETHDNVDKWGLIHIHEKVNCPSNVYYTYIRRIKTKWTWNIFPA